MRSIKVICPICGEKMIAVSWGMERQIYRGFDNTITCPSGQKDNYANYECSCGNKMSYRGTKDCWQKCDKGSAC